MADEEYHNAVGTFGSEQQLRSVLREKTHSKTTGSRRNT